MNDCLEKLFAKCRLLIILYAFMTDRWEKIRIDFENARKQKSAVKFLIN